MLFPTPSPRPQEHLNRGWTLATGGGLSPLGPNLTGSQGLIPRHPGGGRCARLCGCLWPVLRQPLRWGVSLGDGVLDRHGVSSATKLLCDLGEPPWAPVQ